MKCTHCKTENPSNATHCRLCGAELMDKGFDWNRIIIAPLLLLIFAPVALCGVAGTISGFNTMASKYDSHLSGVVFMIAIPSVVIGGIIVWLAIQMLKKK